MLFASVYLLLRRVIRLTAGSNGLLNTRSSLWFLRHQLKVLKRQVGRPRLRRRDPGFLWPRSAGSSLVLGGPRS